MVTVLVSALAPAADKFPERQRVEGAGYAIEFSSGDEAYAKALVAQLPLKAVPAPPPAKLPLTIDDLSARRTEVLKLIGEQLAQPPDTPAMQKVYDTSIKMNHVLAAMPSLPPASRFALWHTEEIVGRLAAGQDVAGFRRAADGGLEVTINASFDFSEGEAPEAGIRRMLDNWNRVVWPIKIGGKPGGTPDAEVRERLETMQQNLTGLGTYQSVEVQRMAVGNVLHETVEATLTEKYIHSPDRRWFCEGVANYVSYVVMESLIGADAAKQYYDVDAALAKNAALRDRVDLAHWPVADDPKAKDVPADVNLANYAFASKAVFEAFREKGTLAKTLTELGKTGGAKANMNAVYAAYEKATGKSLREAVTK